MNLVYCWVRGLGHISSKYLHVCLILNTLTSLLEQKHFLQCVCVVPPFILTQFYVHSLFPVGVLFYLLFL